MQHSPQPLSPQLVSVNSPQQTSPQLCPPQIRSPQPSPQPNIPTTVTPDAIIVGEYHSDSMEKTRNVSQ